MSSRAQAPSGAPRRSGNFAPFLILLVAATAIFILELSGKSSWNILFINPLLNALIVLDKVVLGQFGLAILLFTVLIRLATLPFTIRQFQSMKEMQAFQPKLQEIQKKYKDPRRRAEEQQKLMREHNINPLGCVMPMVIQFGVFIALSSALRHLVGGSPESLVGLSQRLYPIGFLQASIPLDQHFVWLNLGRPDSTYVLPILVAASTYIQQKMFMTPSTSPQQQQQQQMMTLMMPLMIAFWTLNLPSGVGVYWVTTNIFGFFTSYYVYGRSFNWRQLFSLSPAPAATPPAKRQRDVQPQTNESENEEPEPDASAGKARPAHGKRRGKRKKRR